MKTLFSRSGRMRAFLVISTLFLLISFAPVGIRIGSALEWGSLLIERIWAHMGSYSMYLSFFAMGLIVIKVVYSVVKNNGGNMKHWLHKTLRFFARNHIVLSWVALLLAVAHSVYYLFFLSPEASDTYTGIFAIVVMGVVTYVGVLLQYKKMNPKHARLWHTCVGALFITLLLWHNYLADVHAAKGIYHSFFK